MIKIKIRHEKLIGGLGDYKSNMDFDPNELEKGISDESGEHTPDQQIAIEIAKDHLSKNPHYYSDLEAAGIEKPKLSKYWKARLKKRAKKANRHVNNKKDKEWAISQQDRSKKINDKFNKFYQQELEMDDELDGSIDEFLKVVKERKKTFQEPKKFGKGSKKKIKHLKRYKKTGILKAIEYKAKQAKKQGGAVIAGAGAFGSIGESNMSLKRELRRLIIEEIGKKQIEKEKLNENCGDSPQSYFGGMTGMPVSMPTGLKPGAQPKSAKSVDIDPDGYEGRMAKGNLFKMAQYSAKLHNIIQDNENLEPWVEEKIAVAASMIETVAHYLEYEKIRG